MGKSRYFLGVFTSLFIAVFSGYAFAAGYDCPEYKQYTSCKSNYYMSGGEVPGNSCNQCGANSGSTGGTVSTCTCNEGYTYNGFSETEGGDCTLIHVSCEVGEYLPQGASECVPCEQESYCGGGEFDYSATQDQGIEPCPDDYPNSDSGAGAITQCYSDTKMRPWTGSQTPCSAENCANVECIACSIDACEYVAYSNASGTADGILKEGCASNNDSCQQELNLETLTANAGYYVNGQMCSQCPEEYRDGEGAANIDACVGIFQKPGEQITPPTPDGCNSITTKDCEPEACDYKKNFAGEVIEDCEVKTCIKDIVAVTAEANHYANSLTLTCPACDYGYSSPFGSTSAMQCTKTCTVACTRPTCPEHSTSCTIGSETYSGTMNQVTQTCNATSKTCSMTFECETGYTKSGNSCIPNTYEVSYSCGEGTGNAPAGTSQQYGTSYVISSNTCKNPGYTFAGWSDGSTIKQPGQINWTYTKDIEFVAQWNACLEDTSAAGTCDCQSDQYPNGSGCSSCDISCGSVSGFTLGSYNICESETDDMCYRTCKTSDITNSIVVEGSITKGGINNCTVTSCVTGYHPSSNKKSCEPDEYSITLKKNGGTGTINGYTGESDALFPCKHGESCNLPSSGIERTNFTFTGWGTSSSCTSGVYQKTFTGPETLYACWSQETTSCKAGQYYNGTEHVTCPAGMFCSGTGFANIGAPGCAQECPDGGNSAAGSGSITDCYKTCEPTKDIANGNGISTGNAYHNGTNYPSCQYRAECNEGYMPKDSPSANPSCVWADPDECPAGFYCPDGGDPIACPDGGTSEVGSISITQCYKIFDDYEGFQKGTASAKCFYSTATTKYDTCSILEVKSCIAGHWYAQQNAFTCSETDSGYYSPEGQITQTACPVDPYGGKVESIQYADSYTDCYKTCNIDVEHSSTIAPKDNTVYGISADKYEACSFNVTCVTGYTVENNNTETPICNPNQYTITLDKNGGTGSTPASVQCIFDSGACELPDVTGLSRPGYTVQAKWCADKNGSGPCYYAGQSTAANISETGTDTTLYAVWSPNVYEINIDDQNATTEGTPDNVYLKYATGWYTDESATAPISNMTSVPTKTSYIFAGYYSATTGGVQVVASDGKFQTSEAALSFTTSGPATIYARWSAGTTYCEPGKYYTGVGSKCEVCTANNYCPGGSFATDSNEIEGLNACPEQGVSTSGSASITNCYKTKLTYTAQHGTGTQTCNYDDVEKSYSASCKDKVINVCDAGYYLADASQESPDCVPVGNGYYSGGDSVDRTQCPNGGDTETETAIKVQECFKAGEVYEAVYGSGTQRCFYSSGTGADAIYQRDCDTKVINSCRGGYWLANSSDIDCVQVELNYYSNAGDIERHACPANGKTNGTTSDSILLCYKDGLPYTEAQHGTGEYLCYYTSGTGDNAIYSTSCDLPTMTSCDGGYYYDHTILATDCIPADIGYYSPALVTKRTKCPLNGTTATKTSESVAECYRDDMACDIENGIGEQTCNYNETDSNYTLNCQTCNVVSCNQGFSQVDNTCINCPAGSVCDDGKQETCASLTGGLYPDSEPGTTDVAMCYRDCALANNAAAMEGHDYYQSPDTCKISRCLAGYTLDNGQCVECPEGMICDGSEPGSDMKSCADVGNGDWSLSLPGTKDETGCYQKCESYPVIGGTAVPVSDKAFYPNECKYKGISDNGNPCEIVDGVCIETSCNAGYEMKDGVCVKCNREYALEYKEGGVCLVSKCVLGYHPNGDKCENDVQSCTAPNAVYAEKTWDYSKNAFSSCMIKECEYGYHIALNACVSDVQPCNVENGIGFKEWDYDINDWGKCIATSCNPGYTSDPSQTNEHTKQCGECKNRYSVLGKLAASSYIQECEIASCMYQGELYNLENNECVPICPTSEYEDDTGTMVWDESRKKCVRTCKEGYTMW